MYDCHIHNELGPGWCCPHCLKKHDEEQKAPWERLLRDCPISEPKDTRPNPPALLPCPFCGAPGELIELTPNPDEGVGMGFHFFGAYCAKCRASGPPTRKALDKGVEAAMLWNRRNS